MKQEHNLAYKVSAVSIAVNLILSFVKLLAGILASSGAMISDAVHSASDVFSTIIVIVGVVMSRKKSDSNHQYGHERMECMASLLLAAVLALTGAGIGVNGIKKIVGGNYDTLAVPGMLALIAAIVSIVIDVALLLVDSLATLMPTASLQNLVKGLSMADHYGNFTMGILDFADAFFFLSIIALFIFLTSRVLENRRWV